MRRSIRRNSQKCNKCKEAKLAPKKWIKCPTPFQIQQSSLREERDKNQFLKSLVCDCGKIVGQIVYSGKNPGVWRMFDGEQSKLQKMEDHFGRSFVSQYEQFLIAIMRTYSYLSIINNFFQIRQYEPEIHQQRDCQNKYYCKLSVTPIKPDQAMFQP